VSKSAKVVLGLIPQWGLYNIDHFFLSVRPLSWEPYRAGMLGTMGKERPNAQANSQETGSQLFGRSFEFAIAGTPPALRTRSNVRCSSHSQSHRRSDCKGCGEAKKARSKELGSLQVIAMIETRPNRSWYDDNWDWALISLFALVLLAGVVVWTTYPDHAQTAALPDDATTGQSTR
jgi:hypothetical protein